MDLINYGVSNTIYFKLVDSDGNYVTGVTFAAGDIQVSIDGGAYADATNTPTEIGRGTYSLALTAVESTGNNVIVDIVDQDDPKVFVDNGLNLATVGDGNGYIDQSDYKANVSSLALEATVDAVGTAVSAIPNNPLLDDDARIDAFALEATVAGLNDISAADVTDALDAKTYDGKTFVEIMEGAAALGYGNFSVSEVDSSTWLVTLFAQDGTTEIVAYNVDKTTGARTAV